MTVTNACATIYTVQDVNKRKMTVTELIKELDSYPGDWEVMFEDCETKEVEGYNGKVTIYG